MRHLLLALFGVLPFLTFGLCAQEIPVANRIAYLPREKTFPVWLTKKVDTGKVRAGDQVCFKSERVFLLGKTVIRSAVFCGRVVYVQRIEDNEQRESRLSIVVERLEWKKSSMPLNAYIVAFGSYRVFTGWPEVAQPNRPEDRPPDVPDFGNNGGMLLQRKEERTLTFYESLASLHPSQDKRRFDYSTSVKGIKVLRTTVEKKPGTILVRRDRNIVLPRLMPVMLEIEPKQK